MTRAFRIAGFFVSAILCSSCANSVPVFGGYSSTSYSSTNSNGSTVTNGGSSSGSSSSSSSSSTPTGTEPLISKRVSAVGYTTTTITVAAGTVLKMTFTPGVNSTNIAGTGADPQYSQLGVYVTVNGNTQNTGMLSNGLYTGQAQTSPVMDFSSSLSACSGQASTCRAQVTITISHPNDDYFCLNYGTPQYCPWAQMYYDHPWNGTFSIETDDTVSID